MDNLLRLIKLIGGKFIITDEAGQPKAVLMSYKEFEDLVVPGIEKHLTDRFSDLARAEEINKVITSSQMEADISDLLTFTNYLFRNIFGHFCVV